MATFDERYEQSERPTVVAKAAALPRRYPFTTAWIAAWTALTLISLVA